MCNNFITLPVPWELLLYFTLLRYLLTKFVLTYLASPFLPSAMLAKLVKVLSSWLHNNQKAKGHADKGTVKRCNTKMSNFDPQINCVWPKKQYIITAKSDPLVLNSKKHNMVTKILTIKRLERSPRKDTTPYLLKGTVCIWSTTKNQQV